MMRRRGQRSDSVGQLGQRRRDTRPSAVGERRARRSSPPPHAAGGRPSESRPGKGSYALPAHPQGERGSMSYKSREKKRRARIAQLSGRREQRAKFADRHYLTIVSRRACCNRCGGSLREGAECVYRHTPREILCVLCADDKRSTIGPRCDGSGCSAGASRSARHWRTVVQTQPAPGVETRVSVTSARRCGAFRDCEWR
jgi:hypothetical protein